MKHLKWVIHGETFQNQSSRSALIPKTFWCESLNHLHTEMCKYSGPGLKILEYSFNASVVSCEAADFCFPKKKNNNQVWWCKLWSGYLKNISYQVYGTMSVLWYIYHHRHIVRRCYQMCYILKSSGLKGLLLLEHTLCENQLHLSLLYLPVCTCVVT